MKSFTEKAHKRIFEHLFNTQTPVKAKPTQGLFNHKCFENAVQYATTHKDVVVVMGIVTENEKPTLHFWNKKGNTHLETTLGYQAKDLAYYPQRILTPNDFDGIHLIFSDAKLYWWLNFTRWYERPFIEDGRVV